LEILKEVRGSGSGREKGASINLPAFNEEPISDYSNKRVFFYYLLRYILGVMETSMKTEQ
jgi:hypothetical protein